MQNLLYAAVVIGALRVKGRNRLYKATVQTLIKCVFTDCHSTKTAGIEHFFFAWFVVLPPSQQLWSCRGGQLT